MIPDIRLKAKLKIVKSKIHHKGIFATSKLRKNEIIFLVKGKTIMHTYNPDFAKKGSCLLAINKNKWIIPFKNNFWNFINHSCGPNVGLKGKVSVVAMRNIRKGEEVTIDYSITEDDPYWKMKCSCGSKNCRKIVKSVRFLPKKLFEKYKPYIPIFLQKSYIKYNLITRMRQP